MAFTEPQNLTTVPDMMRYAEEVSEDTFAVGLLLSLYLIVFLYAKNKQVTDIACAAGAGFITAIVAIMLQQFRLINEKTLFLCIVSVVIPLIGLYATKK
jgi:hypothetical protein